MNKYRVMPRAGIYFNGKSYDMMDKMGEYYGTSLYENILDYAYDHANKNIDLILVVKLAMMAGAKYTTTNYDLDQEDYAQYFWM